MGFKNSRRDQLGMLHPLARERRQRDGVEGLGAGFVLSRAMRQHGLGLGKQMNQGRTTGGQSQLSLQPLCGAGGYQEHSSGEGGRLQPAQSSELLGMF